MTPNTPNLLAENQGLRAALLAAQAEVERLKAELDQANKRIVELLGERRVLKAELWGREEEL